MRTELREVLNELTEEQLKCVNIPEVTSFNTICPRCLGSGKIKALQRAMTYDAGSIRVHDIEVKCIYCNGTGRKDDK